METQNWYEDSRVDANIKYMITKTGYNHYLTVFFKDKILLNYTDGKVSAAKFLINWIEKSLPTFGKVDFTIWKEELENNAIQDRVGGRYIIRTPKQG